MPQLQVCSGGLSVQFYYGHKYPEPPSIRLCRDLGPSLMKIQSTSTSVSLMPCPQTPKPSTLTWFLACVGFRQAANHPPSGPDYPSFPFDIRFWVHGVGKTTRGGKDLPGPRKDMYSKVWTTSPNLLAPSNAQNPKLLNEDPYAPFSNPDSLDPEATSCKP